MAWTAAAVVDQKSLCDGRQVAFVLLAVAALRHYGWEVAPPELRGLLSKALGAMAIIALVWIIDSLVTHWGVRLVSLIWTFEQSQVIVCSAWHAVDPWPVPVGQAMCSAKLGFDLGTVGVLMMAVGLYRLLTRPATSKPL